MSNRYTVQMIEESLRKKIFLNPLLALIGLSEKQAKPLIPQLAQIYAPMGLKALGERAYRAAQLLLESIIMYLNSVAPDGEGENDNERQLFTIIICLEAENSSKTSDLCRLLTEAKYADAKSRAKYNEFKSAIACPELIASVVLQMFKPLFSDSTANIFSKVEEPEEDILCIARAICHNCSKKFQYVEPVDTGEIFLLASIFWYAYDVLGGKSKACFRLSDLPSYKFFTKEIKALQAREPEHLAIVYYKKALEQKIDVRTTFFKLYEEYLYFFGEFSSSMKCNPRRTESKNSRVTVFECRGESGVVSRFKLLDEISVGEKRYVLLTDIDEPKRKDGKQNARVYYYTRAENGNAELNSIQNASELNLIADFFKED